MSNPFDTTEVDFVAEVTKKFNKDGQLDIAGLAEGKVLADQLINNLKDQIKELEAKAAQGMNIEQLYQKLRSNPPTNNDGVLPKIVTDEKPGVSPDQIKEMVHNLLNETEQTKVIRTNESEVVKKLNEVWGTDATAKLNEAAVSLGVSVQSLREIGQKSPVALFKMLSIDKPNSPPSGMAVAPNTVQPGLNGGTVRNQKYYSDLFKQNPKLRWDSKILVQQHKDALALGEAFFQ